MAACTDTLSCDPQYAARITRYGGTQVIADLTEYLTAGELHRRLDGTSGAEVTITKRSINGRSCCDQLAGVLGGWGCTELEIWRDNGIAWAGPVTVPSWADTTITLTAEDYSAWWARRIIDTDLRFTGVDLSVIFAAVHTNIINQAAIPSFSIAPTLTGLLADRVILAADDRYAIEIIDELARTGIDWTFIGRTPIIGGATITTPPIVLITDQDWVGGGPKLEWAGDRYASRVVMRGADNTRVVRTAPATSAPCGLVTRRFEEPSIRDLGSLTAAADARLAALVNPWRLLNPEAAQLRCGAPVRFDQLVPGARVRVTTSVGCQPVTADFRLVEITANLAESGVSLTLSQLGVGGYVEGADAGDID
jgi:hypothetical protein